MPHNQAQRRLGQLRQLRVLLAWWDTQPICGRATVGEQVLETGDSLHLQLPLPLILSLPLDLTPNLDHKMVTEPPPFQEGTPHLT